MKVLIAFMLVAISYCFDTSPIMQLPNSERLSDSDINYFPRHIYEMKAKFEYCQTCEGPDREFNMQCTLHGMICCMTELANCLDCSVDVIMELMGIPGMDMECVNEIIQVCRASERYMSQTCLQDEASGYKDGKGIVGSGGTTVTDYSGDECEDMMVAMLKSMVDMAACIADMPLSIISGILEGCPMIGDLFKQMCEMFEGDLLGGLLAGDLLDGVTGGLLDGVTGGLLDGVTGGLLDGVTGGLLDGVTGGLLDGVTGGLLDGVTGGLLDGVTGGLLDCVTGGLLDGMTGGLLDGVTGGLLDGVTGGLLDGVTGGLLDGVTGGLLDGVTGGLLDGVTGGLLDGVTGGLLDGVTGGLAGDLIDSLTGGGKTKGKHSHEQETQEVEILEIDIYDHIDNVEHHWPDGSTPGGQFPGHDGMGQGIIDESHGQYGSVASGTTGQIYGNDIGSVVGNKGAVGDISGGIFPEQDDWGQGKIDDGDEGYGSVTTTSGGVYGNNIGSVVGNTGPVGEISGGIFESEGNRHHEGGDAGGKGSAHWTNVHEGNDGSVTGTGGKHEGGATGHTGQASGGHKAEKYGTVITRKGSKGGHNGEESSSSSSESAESSDHSKGLKHADRGLKRGGKFGNFKRKSAGGKHGGAGGKTGGGHYGSSFGKVIGGGGSKGHGGAGGGHGNSKSYGGAKGFHSNSGGNRGSNTYSTSTVQGNDEIVEYSWTWEEEIAA